MVEKTNVLPINIHMLYKLTKHTLDNHFNLWGPTFVSILKVSRAYKHIKKYVDEDYYYYYYVQ